MAAERERFARDFLRHHGARLSGPARGAFAAELPALLARKLGLRGRTTFEAAFRAADLAEHPAATLLAPGSPLFDRMLALALRGGGSSRRYVRRERRSDGQSAAAGQEPASAPPPGEHEEPTARGVAEEPTARGVAEAEADGDGWRAEVRFTFRVSYRAFETLDEVRSIVVDAASGQTSDGRDYFRAKNLADGPESNHAPPPAFDLEGLFQKALAALEAELGPAVHRFAQRAESQLARENERLQDFYVALIAEEKARRERRRTPLAAAAQKEEWGRKLDREARLFSPQVKVALIGIEEVWLPGSRT
jgi:hypothetical protein